MKPHSELLYEALGEPHGIIVETNDVATLRARLYAAKKQDPDLECLSLVPSPTSPDTELWIVKRSQANAQE